MPLKQSFIGAAQVQPWRAQERQPANHPGHFYRIRSP
jgi:hypothetical protein